MIPERYGQLSRMVDAQLAAFPEHRDYLQRRFSDSEPAHLAMTDDIAGMVLKIAGGDLATYCDDYRWLSGIVLEEELHFRRAGNYRLSSFAEADAQVYANREFMSRYMNGLLASQLWWRNHTEVLLFYRDRFIGGFTKPFRHLEVGPGHGLFLYLAAASPICERAEGWDISDASIANTRAALAAMGARPDIALKKVNLFDAPKDSFTSITFSEVLEHLEDPAGALKILHGLLAPGGRIFVNAPVNSPAPDHIYLFRTPEEIVEMVRAAGFEIEQSLFSPCSGATLERARKRSLSISTAVIARRKIQGSGE